MHKARSINHAIDEILIEFNKRPGTEYLRTRIQELKENEGTP